MIISYQWLMEYLPKPLPVAELCRILTSIGLEVEGTEPLETVRGSLEGLIIGQVLTCAKHPNADKLSVTTVTLNGTDTLHIVCGAPNVAVGQKVVVAPVGATVHPTSGESFAISKAKIRGELSEGMICAEDEIGLGSSHAGIIVLPDDAVVGTTAKEYFNIADADHIIHIGLTPNRADANSHIGVARDVCAYLTHHTGKKYHVVMPKKVLPEHLGEPTIMIDIREMDACPRYSGISLRHVKVGPSPEWLQRKLQALGVRSINNIVDITNYVLHEYGQPLHAFDEDKLMTKEIQVRFLEEGTAFLALDDKERKLKATDLMICDGTRPVCIAGVFGGADSGITETTTSVFIESAYFDPTHIRRTSMYHGLRTDAATHFEKGVDINNVIPALIRAATMMVEIAGATISSSIIDSYPVELRPQAVEVSYDFITKLSGKRYGQDAVKELLQSLDFNIVSETGGSIELIVPTNKNDVKQPADIVEEILRIDGLDNIIPTGRLSFGFVQSQPGDQEQRERTAQLLCGMGLQEIVTNSITNSKYYEGQEHLVKMINSLSSELDVMRPVILESGLEVIQYNCNRKNNDLKLFEFGNIYQHRDGKYLQESQLGIWVTGNSTTAHWQQKETKTDIYFLKGLVNNLLDFNTISTYTVTKIDSDDIEEVVWKGKNKVVAKAFKLSGDKLKTFDIKQDVYFAVINWDVLISVISNEKITYKEVPKFPAVQRDLAIILDKQVPYKMVQEVTEQLRLPALSSFSLFDLFESEKLGKDKRSFALNYTFQLQDRTLTDSETDQMMKQLTDVYKNKLKAQIRE